MKFLKKVCVLLLTVMIFIHPITIYGYDDSYNLKDGFILLDDAHTGDTEVTLYILFPQSKILEGKISYEINCLKGGFSDGQTSGLLYFNPRLEGKQKIADVGTGKLVPFKFNIENGTYVFSSNEYTDLMILTPDLESPELRTQYSGVINYPVVVENSPVTLYGIYGDNDFINVNIKPLSDYAKGITTFEKHFSGQDDTDDIKSLKELLKFIGMSSEDIEEFIKEMTLENTNDSTTKDTVLETITIETTAGESDNVLITPAQRVIHFLIIGIFLGIFAIACYKTGKRNKKQ